MTEEEVEVFEEILTRWVEQGGVCVVRGHDGSPLFFDPYELVVDMTTMPGDQFEEKYPGLHELMVPAA